MRSTPFSAGRFISTCAVAATLIVPAIAQAQERPIRVGFGGGVTVPTSDYRDALENGINGQGFVLFRLPGLPLSLRGTLNYNRFEFKPEGLPDENFDGTTQILAGLANVTFDLISAGPIRPYLLAGLGAFNVRTRLEEDGVSDSDSRTNFGIDGGAGLKMRLFGLDAYIEGRVANVYTDEGLVDTRSIQYIPVTFGIMF